jgi:hypothetical protein
VKPEEFRRAVIEPGAAWLEAVTGHRSSIAAKRLLTAIAYQESAIQHRAQIVAGGAAGPARGFWQFEQGGGVKGVLMHGTSRKHALACCEAASVVPEPAPVWRALEGHDLLAYAFARLLLLTDPYAVPETASAGWDCYAKRLWRPGKPHRDKWDAAWAYAVGQYPQVALS